MIRINGNSGSLCFISTERVEVGVDAEYLLNHLGRRAQGNDREAQQASLLHET